MFAPDGQGIVDHVGARTRSVRYLVRQGWRSSERMWSCQHRWARGVRCEYLARRDLKVEPIQSCHLPEANGEVIGFEQRCGTDCWAHSSPTSTVRRSHEGITKTTLAPSSFGRPRRDGD